MAETNLYDFDPSESVLDNEMSGIRALPGDKVSIIVPAGRDLSVYKPTTIEGIVTKVIFQNDLDADDTMEPIKENGFLVDGAKTKMTRQMREFGKKSAYHFSQWIKNKGLTIPGLVMPTPKLLRLDSVLIELDEKFRKTEEEMIDFVEFVSESLQIQNIGGSGNILMVPARWIVVNKSANPNKLPVKASRFPAFGTRFQYVDNDGPKPCMVIESFVIDSKIMVRATHPEGENMIDTAPSMEWNDKPTSIIRFSGITSEIKPSSLGCINIMTEFMYEQLKNSAVESCRNAIFEIVTKWHFFNISQYKVLVNNGEKNRWVSPKVCVGNDDYKLLSFCGGIAKINGQEMSILPNDVQKEYPNDVHIKDLSVNQVTSLCFNAAIGHAVKAGSSTKVFFSTHNAVSLSTNGKNFFQEYDTESREIDATNLQWVFGIVKKSHQEGHEDQDCVYWMNPTTALRDFYLFVEKKGDSPKFKGKSLDEVREMMVNPDYPELVDAFNMICFGPTAHNPTVRSKWSRDFCLYNLLLDIDDLF